MGQRSKDCKALAWTHWIAFVGLYACGTDAGTPAAIGGAAGGPYTPVTTAPVAGTSATQPSQAPGIAQPPAATPTSVVPGGIAATAGGAAVAANAGAGAPAAVSGDATYHKDIRPLIEARCVACHVEGGSGPFPLDTLDKIEPYKGLVTAAVKSRRMPPWPADGSNCRPLRHDQRLTEEQLALFAAWEAAKFPAGNEADYKPLAGEEPVAALPPPDKIIKARTPHQLSAGQEYYACEQVDTRITEDTWVTAMDVVPDNAEYVHHAIVSVGGGSCSALGTTAENVYSYRPGSRTLVFEKGDALLIPAGSVIAIQFHYNTKFAERGKALPADSSAFRLWTLPAGEKPQRAIVRMPHHDLLITIPVGAVDQKEGGTASIGYEYARPGAEIIGISPHMHYLGQTFKETLSGAGGEQCLIDIPDWDQDWQIDYLYEPKDYIKVTSGMRVTQECVYSNRPEDQGSSPDGKQFTPQLTTFGEDTRQEMCLGYIWFRYPLDGAAQ